MPGGRPLPPYVEVHPDGTIVSVYVQPRAAKTGIVGIHGTALKLKVSAQPVDERANEAAAELLADSLDIASARVRLVAGGHSRNKRFVVASVTPDEVASALEHVLSSRAL